MEQIIRRTVIAICVIGVAIGGLLLLLGWRAVETNSALYIEASEKQGESLDSCLARAGSDDELCWQRWRLDAETANVYSGYVKRGGELQVWGLVIGILIPVATLAAFLLFRWIITGRWRNRSRSVRATYIPKDSA